MKKGLIISALSILSIASFFGMYFYVNSKRIKVAYVSYTIINIHCSYGELLIYLSVYNPYFTNVVVKNLEIDVFLGDRRVSLLRVDNPINILSKGVTLIPVQTKLNWSDIQILIPQNSSTYPLTGSYDMIKLLGSTTIKAIGISVKSIPIDAEFSIGELL
jgi:LEA14-like dessication related protein